MERTAGVPPVRQHSIVERGLWRTWTLLVWVLPLGLGGLRFVLPGVGWETIALVLYSPLWYPVLALLGMLPRWQWRARAGKQRQPPTLMIACMLVHWSGLLLAVLSTRGVGDSGTTDSWLAQVIPTLDTRGEGIIVFGAVMLALLGLVGAIIAAGTTRVDYTPRRHSYVSLLLALCLAPLVVLGGLVGQLGTMAQSETDPAGRTERQATQLDVAESAAAEEKLWDEAQRTALPLREALAAEGWVPTGGSGARGQYGEGKGTVRAYANWRVNSREAPAALAERMREVLAADGWKPDQACTDDFEWLIESEGARAGSGITTSAAATELSLAGSEQRGEMRALCSGHATGSTAEVRLVDNLVAGNTAVWVNITGPVHWRGVAVDWYSSAQPDIVGRGDVTVPPRGFAADSWPELGQMERSSVTIDLDYDGWDFTPEPPA